MDPSAQKLLAMQAEMARFESEISSPALRPPLPRLTPDVSLQFIPHALHHRPPVAAAYPPPPPPPPLHTPAVPMPPMPPRLFPPIPPAPIFDRIPRLPVVPASVPAAQPPTIIEAPPTKYTPSESPKNAIGIAPAVFQDFDSSQFGASLSVIPPPPPPITSTPTVQPQPRKSKKAVVKKETMAASSTGAASSTKPAPKRYLRTAGGDVWKDDTLLDWDPNDYRAFCGDLGNEVSDELLAKAFRKYSSFQKAKVIRDKRTNKTKGYGFVSFKEPQDFIRALREMDGKYVGNRPIKLRKSNWRERDLKSVKKKEKGKKKLGLKF